MSPIFQRRALRALVGLNAVLVVLPVAFVAAFVLQIAFWWFTAGTLDDVGWLGVKDLQVVFWVAVGVLALSVVGAGLARWRLGWSVGDTLRRLAAVGVLFSAVVLVIERAGGVDLPDGVPAVPLVALGVVLTYAVWIVPWWFGLRWGQGVLARSDTDPLARRRALGTQGLLLTVWLVSLGGDRRKLTASEADEQTGSLPVRLRASEPPRGRRLEPPGQDCRKAAHSRSSSLHIDRSRCHTGSWRWSSTDHSGHNKCQPRQHRSPACTPPTEQTGRRG